MMVIWKSHLLIASRVLARNAVPSIVNVTGLGIGFATFLILALFIYGEISVDTHHPDRDLIYRVLLDKQFGDKKLRGPETPAPLGPSLVREHPEVRSATRIYFVGSVPIYHDEIWIDSGAIMYADTSFFHVFPHEFLRGDASTALDRPFSVILTVSVADALFGQSDPIGRSVKVPVAESEQWFEVTGVIKDPTSRSHLRYEVILSFETLSSTRVSQNWNAYQYWTYILLRDPTSAAMLIDRLPAIAVEKHGRETVAELRLKYELERITTIYIGPERAPRKGNVVLIYLLATAAVVTLLVACANFVIMSLAQAVGRMREVGVRKSVGARNSEIAVQFLLEAVLITMMAVIVGLGIAGIVHQVILPWVGQSLYLQYSWFLLLIPMCFAIVLLLTLLSASYPAILFASAPAHDILRGNVAVGVPRNRLRQVLISFQCIASVVMGLSAVAINLQLQFVQAKDLGFNGDDVVAISLRSKGAQIRAPLFAEALRASGAMANVALSAGIPGRNFATVQSPVVALLGGGDGITMQIGSVGLDFIETLDLKILAGRSFSRYLGTDVLDACILTASAARSLGWHDPQEAIGKPLYVRLRKREIIGIVADFHHQSLHHSITPTVLLPEESSNVVLARLDPTASSSSLRAIELLWRTMEMEGPLDYVFLKEIYARRYDSERGTGRATEFFTIVMLIIAGMGLYGLASLTVAQRRREIGIRRTMGASSLDIVWLFMRRFLLIVGISFLLACPIAYGVVEYWLRDFAYRVNIGVIPYLFIGAIVFVLAMVAVLSQTLNIARNNPAAALRFE